MSTQESNNLFKHMRFVEALKLYAMQFIIRAKHSLRLIDILLICLVIAIGLIAFTTSINSVRNFKQQATSIVKNTALSLQMMDGEIEDHLQTATYAIELELLKKAPSQKELEELARKFKVTIIYLTNPDGTHYMSSREPVKNSQHSGFLNNAKHVIKIFVGKVTKLEIVRYNERYEMQALQSQMLFFMDYLLKNLAFLVRSFLKRVLCIAQN